MSDATNHQLVKWLELRILVEKLGRHKAVKLSQPRIDFMSERFKLLGRVPSEKS